MPTITADDGSVWRIVLTSVIGPDGNEYDTYVLKQIEKTETAEPMPEPLLSQEGIKAAKMFIDSVNKQENGEQFNVVRVGDSPFDKYSLIEQLEYVVYKLNDSVNLKIENNKSIIYLVSRCIKPLRDIINQLKND